MFSRIKMFRLEVQRRRQVQFQLFSGTKLDGVVATLAAEQLDNI